AGFGTSAQRAGIQFLGIVNETSDAVGDGGTSILNFEVAKISGTSNPLNAARSSVTTKSVLSVVNNGVSYLRMFANGNLAIGTTTDTGHKLRVQGTVSAVLTNATHTSQVYYNTTTGELTYGALPTPATPTLDAVTTAGNSTTNGITVGASVIDGITIWDSNSSGTKNIGIGFQTLLNSTTGFSNTAVGYRAGEATTTGLGNEFFGAEAGINNTTGF
ncbi:MAG: hypothetical protein ACOVOV_14980, partial [Dolichospermum sp.]